MHPAGILLLAAATTQVDFNAHWNDWRAEIDGYRLVQPRYGHARDGSVIMVWVTEPFSLRKHVKLDRPAENRHDLASVMKLNLLRRFRTGIYDYSLMLSVFSPLVFGDGASEPAADRALKVAFSSQEWCGQVSHQLDSSGDELRSQWRSYFESEGDGAESLPLPRDTILEDELWFRLRSLTHRLDAGTYRVIPSLSTARLAHTRLELGRLEVSRAALPEKVKVPAGEFEVVRVDLRLSWGTARVLSRQVWVERAYPHRIIAWRGDVLGLRGVEPVKERGELTGSIRDTYWEHNRPEDDRLRATLHLPE